VIQPQKRMCRDVKQNPLEACSDMVAPRHCNSICVVDHVVVTRPDSIPRVCCHLRPKTVSVVQCRTKIFYYIYY